MNGTPERSQLESRLPGDRAYWDDLAARIVEAAEPSLREQREARTWWSPLAKWSPAIGLAAAAAALLVVAVGAPDPAAPAPHSFEQLLGPDDPVAEAVVVGAATTDIATMLLVESGGQR